MDGQLQSTASHEVRAIVECKRHERDGGLDTIIGMQAGHGIWRDTSRQDERVVPHCRLNLRSTQPWGGKRPRCFALRAERARRRQEAKMYKCSHCSPRAQQAKRETLRVLRHFNLHHPLRDDSRSSYSVDGPPAQLAELASLRGEYTA
jgi:hypothetical protein